MAVTLRRSRRVWIVVAVVVVLVVSGTVFATARSSAAPDYRTARAATGDVKGTLDVIGTIQPVDRADLTFPVAGLVSAVPVTLGQQVTAGAVLAQLDTTALDAQVASAASQLATAKAKLAADRSGQGSTGSAGAAISAAAANAARGGAGSAAAAAPSGAGTAADAARAGIDPAAAAAAAASNPAAAAASPAGAAAAAANLAAAAATANPATANPAAASPAANPAPVNPAPADAARAGTTPNAAAANAAPGKSGPTDNSRGTAVPAPVPAPPATGPAQQALVQATDALTKARDAREQHQKDAEAALAGVQHDLDAAGTTCEPAADALSDAPSDVPADVTTCQAALREVLDGQTEVARLQQQVATDNKALDAGVAVLLQAAAKLAAAATAIPVVPPAAVPPAVPPAAAPPAAAPPAAALPAASTPARSVTPGGGTARATTGASAEQLAADQAAVDAAAAQLTTAQQNRDQAALTSPIDGTVGALNLQPGQKVSGAGTAQVVVVGAARGFQVQATVGEGDVARLAVGNTVTVTPDGATAPIDGKVTSIGILPTTATTGAVTYPVTIALPAGTGPFPAGQGAAVAIEVADVAGVLTVPTSAVHTAGAQRTVEVVRGGRAVPVEVQVGAVGATRTEITSGLAAGDEVVLADPSRPLPTTGLSGLSRIGGR